MKNKSYIKCELYNMVDNSNCSDNGLNNDNTIDLENEFIRPVIVNLYFGQMYELLTGIEFDYSIFKVGTRYSKLRKKFIIKEKEKPATESVHVSLYYENLDISDCPNTNYKYASTSDLRDYYHDVICEFGTIENYKNYLLSLKKMYNNSSNIVKNNGKTKKITMTRI